MSSSLAALEIDFAAFDQLPPMTRWALCQATVKIGCEMPLAEWRKQWVSDGQLARMVFATDDMITRAIHAKTLLLTNNRHGLLGVQAGVGALIDTRGTVRAQRRRRR
jgi:hypothetical protein